MRFINRPTKWVKVCLKRGRKPIWKTFQIEVVERKGDLEKIREIYPEKGDAFWHSSKDIIDHLVDSEVKGFPRKKAWEVKGVANPEVFDTRRRLAR